jgi:biopolymer transport protein ExbB/TolQ
MVALTVFLLSILGGGYLWYEFADIPFIHKFWEYLNNSTVATLTGFGIAIIAYIRWKSQHTQELDKQNIKEFLDNILRWYHIKKGQIRYRKLQGLKKDKKAGERKEELDIERLYVTGIIEVRWLLLKDYRRNHSKIQEIYDEFVRFGKEEKDFASIKNKKKKDYDKINKKLENSLEKLETLISQL